MDDDDLLQRLEEVCRDDHELGELVTSAMTAIERAVAVFGWSQLALSFNGGKDSTVLFHLLRAVGLRRVARGEQRVASAADARPAVLPLLMVYFDKGDDFSEITDFTTSTTARYGVELMHMRCSYKAGLQQLVDERGIKGIFLGTRSSDPHAGSVEVFCPTSPGWPPMMRISPILNWTYPCVWRFLRACGLQYCCLYDLGYTSLGAKHSSLPNPALRLADGAHSPAYMLQDGRLEREGRQALETQRAQEACAARLHCTVGVVLVGDELLSGEVKDENGWFLCKGLQDTGASVQRLLVVPDLEDSIASAIASFAPHFHAVIVCGGIGPTDDDVTMQAVSRALGRPLLRHVGMVSLLQQFFGSPLPEAYSKMALVPHGARLVRRNATHFPVVVAGNVYVLPGIPRYMRRAFQLIRCEFGGTGAVARALVLACPEVRAAEVVNALRAGAAEEWASVGVGYYPCVPVEEEAVTSPRTEAGPAAAEAAATSPDAPRSVDSSGKPAAAPAVSTAPAAPVQEPDASTMQFDFDEVARVRVVLRASAEHGRAVEAAAHALAAAAAAEGIEVETMS